MDAGKFCPFCVQPIDACPHLLVSMGKPGETIGGALADRLKRLWRIIIVNVGDDPALDARGVYSDSWQELCARFGRATDLVIEADDWVAMFIKDADRVDSVVEACIAADEL
jgi:hypothetical protein